MASSQTETVSGRVEPATKDLVRFRRYLRGGAPGPHIFALLLGLDAFETTDLLRAVADGLPYGTFERLRRNTALPVERLADLVGIPRRTMTRRKQDGRFLANESDRLLRVSRVFGKALELDVRPLKPWASALTYQNQGTRSLSSS